MSDETKNAKTNEPEERKLLDDDLEKVSGGISLNFAKIKFEYKPTKEDTDV